MKTRTALVVWLAAGVAFAQDANQPKSPTSPDTEAPEPKPAAKGGKAGKEKAAPGPGPKADAKSADKKTDDAAGATRPADPAATDKAGSEAKESSTAPAAPQSKRIISSELDGRDLMFLQEASYFSRLLAHLGDLAKTRAESEQVKAVGDALVSAQNEESKIITVIARQKGVTVAADSKPPKSKALESLEKLKGAKFDKSVLEQIARAGQQSVAAYENATQSKDGQIKRFAEQMLPVAKDKLRLANMLSGNAPNSNASPGFRTQNPAESVRP